LRRCRRKGKTGKSTTVLADPDRLVTVLKGP
jgi:hypothetical protein